MPIHPNLVQAIQWRFCRSSGPGGQSVNKTATAVQLVLSWQDLHAHLPAPIFTRLQSIANHFATQDGLLIESQQSRGQLANRGHALAKLEVLLNKAYNPPKKRKQFRGRPPGVERKRLQDKARHSARKQSRGSKFDD